MTKQVVWTFREFLFLQFDTKFASNEQRLAKIGTILWFADIILDFASLTYHTARRKCRVWHAVLYGATNLLALATRIFPMRLVIECHEQMAIKILSFQSPVQ